jgi:hypothetical protein
MGGVTEDMLKDGSAMTDRTLSPAAQSVLDAYWKSPWDPSLQHEDRYAIAAALRAVADKVVPEFWHEDDDIYGETMQDIRKKLFTIAAELEGAND